MALFKLHHEYRELLREPVMDVVCGPVSENDLFNWKATIIGPEDSPYAGGLFFLNLFFSSVYPFQPPKLQFTTKIYHPNVDGETGYVCWELLQDQWSPKRTMREVLSELRNLLLTPSASWPLEPQIAEKYVKDHAAFTRVAREWTQRYGNARGKLIPAPPLGTV